MKKYLATYFALFSVLFMGVSCVSSEDEDLELSPYALLRSFNLGNVKSYYPSFTSTGEDTVIVKTISASSFPFTINQLTGEVYNADSLPFGTDASKLVSTAAATGVISVYVDSTGTYEHFSSTDSLDYTSPRKFRIYAADAQYYKDYTVRVNVHKVDPDLMVWNSLPSPEGLMPQRAIEFAGNMNVFGTAADGSLLVASSPLGGELSWSKSVLNGLPGKAALATVQQFQGCLYVVSDGDLYKSFNAVDWELSAQDYGLVAIVAVSDSEGRMWAAGNGVLYSSADGSRFERAGDLPSGFPLYGVSLASYPLSHNKNIVRNMLIGYATPEMNGVATVWSKLSTEDKWVEYDNEGNPFPCPSLKGLAVLHYNGYLYALGGSGVVAGDTVPAFSDFYVSKDNGIVWKGISSFHQALPAELKGSDSPFAVTVDSDNYMWIIGGGNDATVWKGIINHLGFKKK